MQKYKRRSRNVIGVDGMLPKHLNINHCIDLHKQLRDGTYATSGVRIIKKKKSNGKFREIRIFTMRDLVAQKAMSELLTITMVNSAIPTSHGFMPNRSVNTFFDNVLEGASLSPYHIVCDIEEAYPNVNRQLLLYIINQNGITQNNLYSIRMMLQDNKGDARYVGIPQGSPLSPILFNIYMQEFDNRFKNYKTVTGFTAYYRYADNFVMYAHSLQLAVDRCDSMVSYARDVLGLHVNAKIYEPAQEYTLLGKLCIVPTLYAGIEY